MKLTSSQITAFAFGLPKPKYMHINFGRSSGKTAIIKWANVVSKDKNHEIWRICQNCKKETDIRKSPSCENCGETVKI